jgi:hypothetical protein
MRRFLTALTVAAATLALTATAALAAVTVVEGGFDRDCIDDPAGRFITGTVEVTADSSGTLTLTLLGKIEGQEDVLQTEVIVVDGSVDTTYEFTFENVPTEDADGDLYQSYLIQTDGLTPEQAESINVEVECDEGFIPEAPIVVLLLGTGLAATGWFLYRNSRRERSILAA